MPPSRGPATAGWVSRRPDWKPPRVIWPAISAPVACASIWSRPALCVLPRRMAKHASRRSQPYGASARRWDGTRPTQAASREPAWRCSPTGSLSPAAKSSMPMAAFTALASDMHAFPESPMKTTEFSNRIAVVIGGTRGIGRARAHLMAAGGATVIVTGTDRERAEDEARQINTVYGVRACGRALDLGDYASISVTLKAIAAEHGGRSE